MDEFSWTEFWAYVSKCENCFALVMDGYMDEHQNWHRTGVTTDVPKEDRND